MFHSVFFHTGFVCLRRIQMIFTFHTLTLSPTHKHIYVWKNAGKNVLFSRSAATPASKNHIFLVKAADLFCLPQRPWELLLWHGALLKFLAAAGLLKDLCKNPGSAEMFIRWSWKVHHSLRQHAAHAAKFFSRSYQVIHQIVFLMRVSLQDQQWSL